MTYNYTIDLDTSGTYSVNNGDFFLYETDNLQDAKEFIANHILGGNA